MCLLRPRRGGHRLSRQRDSKNNGSGALNPADRTYRNEFRMNEGVEASYTKFHDQIDNNPYNRVHILNEGNMNLAYFDLQDAR